MVYKLAARAPLRSTRSEFFQALNGHLKVLLDFAHISDSFKEVISDDFRTYYFVGIEKDGERYDILSRLIEENELADGGIFDRGKAIDVERSFYRRLSRDELLLLRVKEFDNETLTPYLFIARWRQDFVERYGDEP